MIIAKVKYKKWIQRVSCKSNWSLTLTELVDFISVENINETYNTSTRMLIDCQLIDTENLKSDKATH